MPAFAAAPAASPVAEAAASAVPEPPPVSLDWDVSALFGEISPNLPSPAWDDVELPLDDEPAKPVRSAPAAVPRRPQLVQPASPLPAPRDTASVEAAAPSLTAEDSRRGGRLTLTRGIAIVGAVALIGAIAWPRSGSGPAAATPTPQLQAGAGADLQRVVANAGDRVQLLGDRAAKARIAERARLAQARARKRRTAARRRAAAASRGTRHATPAPALAPRVSRAPAPAPVVVPRPRPRNHAAPSGGGSGTDQLQREFGL